MLPSDFRFGFRIVGSPHEDRRLVDAALAFAGYVSCDERAEVAREAYLSAFQFGPDFAAHLEATGSTAGFSGACWAPWLWWDIDREDLDAALKDARRLALGLDERFRLPDDAMLLFFSGSKGFHVGLPTMLWSPAPGEDFHKTARRFAERAAELAGVSIDTGIYDRVRAFRAPNSRHPKTGLHKRRLTLDELNGLSLERILELAKAPESFEVPTLRRTSDQAAVDWRAAADEVEAESEGKAARRATGNGATLNRSTLDFIREGATAGDRHRLLFSAAANLGEFNCSIRLAEALLEESALDSGLSPKDVVRGIEGGLSAGWNGHPDKSTHQDAQGSPQGAQDGSAIGKPPEAATGDSGGVTGQSCQQVTGATGSTAVDLAALWNRPAPPPPKIDQAAATVTPPTPPATPADPPTPPAVDVRATLARLWGSTPPPPTPPPQRLPPPGSPPGATPPPGATLHFAAQTMRPCSPADAFMWTWEGAPRWYHVAEYPVPVLGKGGAA
jgi:hypothetical protein